jgi:glyoxylase-like metal-dependent hydrolase (beta-lactamase superfamily II)
MLTVAAVVAALIHGPALAQDASAVISAARQALGNVQSVTYSGSARDVAFQQCGANATALICYGTHDPMRPITNYVRVIDLAAPTTRHTGGTQNFGAGGSTTVTPGTFFQQVTAAQADVSQPWNASLDLYLTPWGFLKGAADNNATARTQRVGSTTFTVLSWSPRVTAPSGASYRIDAYVNGDNLIERVETWLGENIMGDMHIVANYSGWRDFGGAMVPTRIVQTRGGWPFFEVDVTNARGNPPDLASLAPAPAPAAGRGGGAPGGAPGGGRAGGAPGGAPGAAAGGRAGGGGAPGAAPGGRAGGAPAGAPGGAPAALVIEKEELAPWLFRYTTGTGSYDSLVAEFDDYVMLLEAGQNQARAAAYVEEIKRQFPDKPIRYVFVTHPHADHTGGLPVLVAEGAAIITHENNREFFERALNTPRTLLDDALSRNPRRARVEGVGDSRTFTDGEHTVEFYHIFPAPHSNGLLVAYFPAEKVLFQGDFSVNPGQPANDHVRALVPALEKLGLDYERYINVHVSAAPQTRADVMAAMGN